MAIENEGGIPEEAKKFKAPDTEKKKDDFVPFSKRDINQEIEDKFGPTDMMGKPREKKGDYYEADPYSGQG